MMVVYLLLLWPLASKVRDIIVATDIESLHVGCSFVGVNSKDSE
jgi:hypothetical protein